MVNKNHEMKKLNNKNEIYHSLLELSNAHTPPFVERISNIDEYVEKLSNHAEVYVIIDLQILGIIAFYANDIKNKVAYITHITVQSNVQNMGLGKILLQKCIDVSVENGMRELKLEVNKNNTKAIRFYEKNGFIHAGDASTESKYMTLKI
ncbi:GNAT family N-acetyltransferase [Metabacillus niabensis]|uniref:Ribosomal protein S18 acetylase RimI-like enzyme n=1 Tax=Metabacillus niabensis TaxID=324854 RepID=A0ABT9Z566_9BACI|nr:GNAT family N-acetyltransferase [Metabacillus niabensis]MDQ0227130.1 ribosomal protein S18 acetylase RimI-like enzyme [Metabacillus niabensis]